MNQGVSHKERENVILFSRNYQKLLKKRTCRCTCDALVHDACRGLYLCNNTRKTTEHTAKQMTSYLNRIVPDLWRGSDKLTCSSVE